MALQLRHLPTRLTEANFMGTIPYSKAKDNRSIICFLHFRIVVFASVFAFASTACYCPAHVLRYQAPIYSSQTLVRVVTSNCS